MSWGYFKPYVSVAQRKANAAKEVAKMVKKGRTVSPIKIEGLKIARTFWGKAWCGHLESYSDFANRLPRGRTYVRNGSVVDLQIEPGRLVALVAGSELYTITIDIKPAQAKAWTDIKGRCAGQIGSLIELLQGKLSQGVMQIITERDNGLFPKPAEIDMDCSCPDSARLCKHLAAVLYGVGARLDKQPELLFLLRRVDHLELIAQAGDAGSLAKSAKGRKTIDTTAVADVFGIELESSANEPAPPASSTPLPPSPVAPASAQPRKASSRDATVGRTGGAEKSTSRGKVVRKPDALPTTSGDKKHTALETEAVAKGKPDRAASLAAKKSRSARRDPTTHRASPPAAAKDESKPARDRAVSPESTSPTLRLTRKKQVKKATSV